MAQHYSNPTRAKDSYSLPNVETFYMSPADIAAVRRDNGIADDDDCDYAGPGWYFWYCFPGCMPEGSPNGPYDTEALAIAAMRAEADDDDDDRTCVQCGEALDDDADDDTCASCRQAEEDDTIQPDDLTTSDGRTFWEFECSRPAPACTLDATADGRYRLTTRTASHPANGNVFPTQEDAIRAYMDGDQFWPNVWTISDHGNAHRWTFKPSK